MTMRAATLRRTALGTALVVAMLLWAGLARADFFDGMFAFDQGDYAEALEQWSTGAKQRDPRSLFGLGQLYEGGHGVEADPVRAYALYDIAADMGFKQARDARTDLSKRLSFQDLSKGAALSKELSSSQQYVAVGKETAAPEVESTVVTTALPAAPEPELIATDAPETEIETGAEVVPKPEPTTTAPPDESSGDSPTPSSGPARGEPRLQFDFACTLKPRWQDGGSGGVDDVATYDPQLPPGHLMVGSYVQGSYQDPHGCVTVVGPGSGDGQGQVPLLVAPVEWQLIWADKGSGARQDGSVWRAVAPSPDYACIGSVARSGYGKPTTRDYVCLHQCLVQAVSVPNAIWTDKGTGAAAPVAFYRLPRSNTLFALPTRSRPKALTDLNLTAQCLYQ